MRAQASMAIGRFGNHRQVDRDAIAPPDAQRLERVGAAADLAGQIPVRQDAAVARLALPDDRGLVAAGAVEVPVDAIGRSVELARRRTTWRAGGVHSSTRLHGAIQSRPGPAPPRRQPVLLGALVEVGLRSGLGGERGGGGKRRCSVSRVSI